MTKDQQIANLKLALRIGLSALDRVNDLYDKGYTLGLPSGRTVSLDAMIPEWGLQGAINEMNDALKGVQLDE